MYQLLCAGRSVDASHKQQIILLKYLSVYVVKTTKYSRISRKLNSKNQRQVASLCLDVMTLYKLFCLTVHGQELDRHSNYSNAYDASEFSATSNLHKL